MLYKSLTRYSRQLQRRFSSPSLELSSSSSPQNLSKRPLLPESILDASPSSAASSSSYSLDSSMSKSNHNTANNSNNNNNNNISNNLVIPTHAYVTLATAVVALSSVGPSLDLQHGVAPLLKVYWRMTGTWMVLLPMAAVSIARHGPPQLRQQRHVLQFVSASFCYAVMCVGFVQSLEYTSVGNAVIFSNTHALLLLLGRYLVQSPVSFLESGGALTAFLGGIFCTYDESLILAAEEETTTTTTTTTAAVVADDVAPIWVGCLGDFLALISALGGVLYLVLAAGVRARFPSVHVFVCLNMFTASWITLAMMLFLGQEVEASRNIHTGLWGFMNTRYDRLPLEMFMVIVCNLIGSMGYLKSTIYFDNMVICVATLMEPVVASVLAFVTGVGVLPGFLGLIGNLLVALGTVMVITPRSHKKN